MFKSKADRLAARLHQHSANNNNTTGGSKSQININKQDFFNQNWHRIYSCIHCRAHLANHDELISKLFQGNHGRAYLFNKVVNVGQRQAVQRELLTGLHAVADIYCDNCETTLGWKYEQAFVPSQKYKEGKYIIELVHMLKENTWDPSSYNARDLLRQALRSPALEGSQTIGSGANPPNKLPVKRYSTSLGKSSLSDSSSATSSLHSPATPPEPGSPSGSHPPPNTSSSPRRDSEPAPQIELSGVALDRQHLKTTTTTTTTSRESQEHPAGIELKCLAQA